MSNYSDSFWIRITWISMVFLDLEISRFIGRIYEIQIDFCILKSVDFFLLMETPGIVLFIEIFTMKAFTENRKFVWWFSQQISILPNLIKTHIPEGNFNKNCKKSLNRKNRRKHFQYQKEFLYKSSFEKKVRKIEKISSSLTWIGISKECKINL
jgi:hypothetical protein